MEIPEIVGSDAPVAVEWTPQPTLSVFDYVQSDRAISGSDGKQMTRWYEGSHWQRLSAGHFYGTKDRGGEIAVSDLQAMFCNQRKLIPAKAAIGLHEPVIDRTRPRTVDVESDPRGRFETIRTDGRVAALENVHEGFSRLISVDGMLYRKCIEPYISVRLDFEAGRLCVKDVGIETTAEALWGATTKTFACFELGKWDEAMEFVREPLMAGANLVTLSSPTVLMPESLTYDWEISYKAAIEAKSMQTSLRLYSRAWEPKLDQVVLSQDAEEQYELMASIDRDNGRWAGNDVAQRSYDKVIEILDNRVIAMRTGDQPAMRR